MGKVTTEDILGFMGRKRGKKTTAYIGAASIHSLPRTVLQIQEAFSVDYEGTSQLRKPDGSG